MVNTKIDLCGLMLDNPVIPASGTFGFGEEFAELYDLNLLGSFVTKGITRKPRFGNEQPRIAEAKCGMLNSVGLQNVGVENAPPLFEKIKGYYQKPVIANVSGFSVEEYAFVAERISKIDNVGIIEVNVSCPNVSHGGMAFGTDERAIAEVVSAVKRVSVKPVFVKLSPNVTSISALALSAKRAGADGISLINTLLGARIDIRRRKFVLANRFGGLSGAGIFPVAVRMVAEVYEATGLPIIGMGGVESAADVLELMMAGATAVEVGAANLTMPLACKNIVEELPRLMEKLNINSLADIIGIATK